MTRQRFAWLATCALFVACASAPTGGKHSEHAHKKKKKKKKKRKKNKKKSVAVFDRRDDDEVRIIDDEDEDEDAPRREDKDDKDDEESARREREKRDREEREQEKREREREREEAAERRAEKKRREQEKEEAAREKEREREKKKERAEREKERLAEKKRKEKERAEREEAEEREAEDDDDEDRDAKRKREAVAEAEPAEIDMSEGGSELIEMDDEPPPGRVAAIPVPGVDDEDDEEEDEPEVDLPPGAMPLAINSRPLTRPKDKLAFHGGIRVDVLTLPDAAGMDQTSTTDSLALGVSYGVSDQLEVGADYAPSISPGSAKGPLTLHGAYLAVHQDKLDVALAGGIAVDFYSLTDPASMSTSTRALYSLQLGAWARYRLTPKASLISGVPAVPATTASLSKLSFALPPLPYQLAIGLNGGGTVALDLPIGVGYQAKPKVYALAMLNLAHIRIANTANAFLFKDFIPISLGGFYSLDKIDVGALFSDDLKQGTDYLRFEIVARYSLK